MKTRLLVGAAALCVLNCLAVARAQDLKPIEADMAKAIGKLLSAEADKFEKPRVRITADSEKANGLHVPDEAGVLVVPQKDLKESEEFAAKMKTETGAELGYVFFYHIVPVINGQKVEASQLRSVKITSDNGTERTVHVLALAAKQVADDDYRLHGYGAGERPLVDVKFSQEAASVAQPIGLSVKDRNDEAHQGTLVVTVFGKYQAGFRCGHVE